MTETTKTRQLRKLFFPALFILFIGGYFLLDRLYLENYTNRLTPELFAWESRYLAYDNEWYINDRIYDEHGLSDEDEVEIIYGPFIHLDKGTYYAKVDYEASDDQRIRIYSFENEDKIVTLEETVLIPESRSVCYRFDLEEDIDNFEIRICYDGKGSLLIKDISVHPRQWGQLYHLGNLMFAMSLLFLTAGIAMMRPEIYRAGGKRELWIDAVRGIGIFFVLFAHTAGNPFNWLIYGFHMPLFFMLSGYLFKRDSLKRFCFMVGRRYFIPYMVLCFANSLLRIPYMMVGDYTLSGIKNNLFIYWAGSLKGLWREMPNCMPLWFLPSLAVALLAVRLIMYIPVRYVRIVVYVICAIAGYTFNIWAGQESFVELPYGLHTVFTGVAFIAIGCGIKECGIIKKVGRMPHYAAVVSGVFITGIVSMTLDHRFFHDVDIYYNSYGNMLLTYTGAVFTSVAIMLMCNRLSGRIDPLSVSVVVGTNSTFFFAFDFWGKDVALNFPRIFDTEIWIVTFVLKAIFVSLLFVLWKNAHSILRRRLY